MSDVIGAEMGGGREGVGGGKGARGTKGMEGEERWMLAVRQFNIIVRYASFFSVNLYQI